MGNYINEEEPTLEDRVAKLEKRFQELDQWGKDRAETPDETPDETPTPKPRRALGQTYG